VEEMSFPRLCAVAEIAWSPEASRDFTSFSRRLEMDEARLKQAGIVYWDDHAVKIGDWKPEQLKSPTNTLEWDVTPQIAAPGKYRLSLDYQKGKQALKVAQAALLENEEEISRDTHEGLAGAGYNRAVKAQDWNYFLDLPAVKPGAHYAIRVSVAGGTNSTGVVFLDPPAPGM
jgi:hexosaminidase